LFRSLRDSIPLSRGPVPARRPVLELKESQLSMLFARPDHVFKCVYQYDYRYVYRMQM
jgi:hypothetical protein